MRISSREKIFFLSEELTYKYGGHDDQLSKKYWGMDEFRVCAIEKNIKNNIFSLSQKILAIRHLIKKIKIITKGGNNRSNHTGIPRIY